MAKQIPEELKLELTKTLLEVFQRAETHESPVPVAQSVATQTPAQIDGIDNVEKTQERFETPEKILHPNEGYNNGSIDDEISKEPLNLSFPQRYAFACEEQKKSQDAYKKCREQNATAEEKRSATSTEINTQFGNSSDSDSAFIDAFSKALESFNGFKTPNNVHTRNADRKAAQKVINSVSVPFYSKDTATVGDKTYKFARVKKEVSWEKQMSDVTNTHDAYVKLQGLVTRDILNQFGSWERIQEIIVFDNHLIINGVCYEPIIPNSIVEKLPLDTYNYVSCGMLAPLFNWGRLRLMSGLQYLRIDDPAFYRNYMRSCLNWHKDITALFNICGLLDVICIGADVISRNADASVVKKYQEGEVKRGYFDGVMNGYKLNICKNTSDFQHYTFSCLKDYAKNKGDKNIFMYLGGIASRTALTTGAVAVNFTTNVLGGIGRGAGRVIKSIRNVFKQGFTPVGSDDFE